MTDASSEHLPNLQPPASSMEIFLEIFILGFLSKIRLSIPSQIRVHHVLASTVTYMESGDT